MVHANAPLSELGRLRLARCVVEDGWPIARAAERFQVSRTTTARWVGRYREAGVAGMSDRSSRPHRSPNRTPAPVVRKIVHHRTKKRLGPVQIAALVGVAPSTVHRVLTRCGLQRLAWLDRATGAPVRYEYSEPGGAGPRRHQEAREHPRQWRLEEARPHGRKPQPQRRQVDREAQ